jgi:hypothetical protein
MNRSIIDAVFTLLPIIIKPNPPTKIACRDSILTGDAYFKELMATRNLARFREVARMDKKTFKSLHSKLFETGILKSSRHICSGQKLMVFLYSLTGHRSRDMQERLRVLMDALTKELPLRARKFYLGDAGYGLLSFVLTPYRGVRYHLKEWKMGNERPRNKKELFNLRHSSLRNVIERVFGVLKMRFPLLTNMTSYRYEFQVELVICIMILHNFIKSNQLYADPFDEQADANIAGANEDIDENEILENEATNNDLKQWRDDIAEQMWVDYQSYILQQGNY